MPRYEYRAFAGDGGSAAGHVDAGSESEALDLIAAQGLTPVSVRAGTGSDGPWWNRDITLRGSSGQARPGDLERFFTTLATMLASSLPLLKALTFCSDQEGDRTFGAMLRRLRDGVERGRTLGALMTEEPAFPDRLALLVSLGERSNQLAAVSARLARQLHTEVEIRRELRSALIYPVILLVMSALVLALLVFYLAPTLLPVFRTAGSEPPGLLAAMASLGEFVSRMWPAILIVIAASVGAIVLIRKKLKAVWFRVALALPLVGTWIRQRETAALSRTLGLLLTSGATIQSALQSAATGTTHPGYRHLLDEAETAIVAGRSLAATLGASDLIDPMARVLIEAGEETDRLAELLETVADRLAARSAETLARLLALMVPILTLVIGVGVGGLILSVITAILDLNDIAL